MQLRSAVDGLRQRTRIRENFKVKVLNRILASLK
jgi:hypothetical protein